MPALPPGLKFLKPKAKTESPTFRALLEIRQAREAQDKIRLQKPKEKK